MALTLACGMPQQAGEGDGPQVKNGGPKVGGVFKARSSRDPSDWDVTYMGKDVGSTEMRSLAQQSLLTFKTGPEVDHKEAVLQPQLAERWEVSPDATTYTFHLRKGIMFQNIAPVNGREFTSADVKWSLEYLSRTGQFKDKKLPASNIGYMLEGVEQIDTPDPYTAVVRFEEPFAPFLNYVAHPFLPMLAHEIYDQDGHFHDKLIGTGPFMLDQAASQQGTRWVMKKNPSYWDAGKPYLDELDNLILPDDATATAAFQTKQIDMLPRLLPAEANQLKPKAPDAVAFQYGENPMHIYLNNSQPPFNNPVIRHALFLGIDRDEFIRVMADNEGSWAIAGTTPGTFTQEEIKALQPYDPAQARRLLAEAGYPNGITVDAPYPPDRGQIYITRIELLQSQLAKAGFNLAVKAMPYTQYSDLRRRGQHTIQYANRDITADVDSYLTGTFYPTSGNNYDRVNEPRLNELILAQRREPDPAKRNEIVRQAAKYLATECYCGLAVYYGNAVDFWQGYVKNYRPNWYRNGWPLEATWLDK